MKALFVAALMLCAGPALALSCLRPDVASSFIRANEAEETYVVVHGRLSFDDRLIPEYDMTRHDRPETRIPARLTGFGLSRTGFDLEFDRDVTLLLQCFGPWCGGAVSDAEYLIFMERTEVGYIVPADPCGSMVFSDPTPAQLDRVARCMAGKACEPIR